MIARYEKRALSGTDRLLAQRYKNAKNLPHWHAEHEWICVESGRLTLTTDQGDHILSKGDFAFLKGEEIHSLSGTSDNVIAILKLAPLFVRPILGQKRLLSPVLQCSTVLMPLWNDLFTELREKREHWDLIAEGMALRLMAEMLRRESVQESEVKLHTAGEKFRQLLQWLSRNAPYATFEEAAAHMEFSAPYFSKYFQSMTGTTFTDYLNALRVSMATELVAEGRLEMTEVAMACGFGTIRNFNRVFKTYTGYTPRTLPRDYVFTHHVKGTRGEDFDPTLQETELLEL
ncbi:MAG: helix-turn-helix transcriptional regulator [Clostridia bacterium]|nr:helix-turn-helix transcriptional regulator [Clostridia bacterium]